MSVINKQNRFGFLSLRYHFFVIIWLILLLITSVLPVSLQFIMYTQNFPCVTLICQIINIWAALFLLMLFTIL